MYVPIMSVEASWSQDNSFPFDLGLLFHCLSQWMSSSAKGDKIIYVSQLKNLLRPPGGSPELVLNIMAKSWFKMIIQSIIHQKQNKVPWCNPSMGIYLLAEYIPAIVALMLYFIEHTCAYARLRKPQRLILKCGFFFFYFSVIFEIF